MSLLVRWKMCSFGDVSLPITWLGVDKLYPVKNLHIAEQELNRNFLFSSYQCLSLKISPGCIDEDV